MESQKRNVSLSTEEGRQELLKFCASYSQSCLNFTKGFLQLLQLPESQAGTLPAKYASIFQASFKYTKIKTPSPICAKLLPSHSFAFKCYECQLQDNSIICIQCFNKSNHVGHNYQKIAVAGGCCDCGDDQKWSEFGSCVNHKKKQDDFILDQKETKKFITQMQYVLYLEFALSISKLQNRRIHERCLQQAFIIFLTGYNQGSMISNQQTFQLLKSFFSPQLPGIQYGQRKLTLKNLTVFHFFMKLHKQKQFSRMAVNLFIMMFTRPQFKKYLTINYNKQISKKPEIGLSQLSGISCQIFTSHKIVSQLMEAGKFPPLQLKQITDSDKIKFETVAEIYNRHYFDILYLSKLYNGVGPRYVDFHLNEGNITNFSGYQQYVRRQPEDSIQYYGIQKIMFNYAFQMLKLVSNKKQTILKAIKDLIQYIKKSPNDLPMSVYIPKQRTFMMLLFLYFDGDISKALNKGFLKQVLLSPKLIYKILQATLYVIRFYSVSLANRQTVQRFYTFFSISLYKKPRSIVSLDFQLLKFCILALDLQQDFNVEQQEEFQDENISYINFQLSYTKNKMPIQNIISLPFKFVQNLNCKQIKNTQEGAYDRRKALGVFTDYIGLLHQIIITNHSQLNVRMNLQLHKQNQIINFYGQLLKSIQSIKFEEFKQICSVFFKQDVPFLEKFIKQNCVIDNKKVKLQASRQNQFQSINLSYLKSKKSIQFFEPFISLNKQKNGFNKIPISPHTGHVNQILKNALFNPVMIDSIIRTAMDYLSIFKMHPQIIQVDVSHFYLYLEQVTKINHTLHNKGIRQILQIVKQHQNIFNRFPEYLKKQILLSIGKQQTMMQQQKPKQKQAQDKKAKMLQLKAKKLQKFKNKQQKVVSLHQQENTMQNQNEQQLCCMFCKLGDQQEPLSILCFKQSSNLFLHAYTGIKRSVQFITTCGHFAHQNCHKQVNKQKQYSYCYFCKTSSNLLLPAKFERKISLDFLDMSDEDDSDDQPVFRKSKSLVQKTHEIFTIEGELKKNKSTLPLNTKQKNVQKIASYVIYGAVVDYDFFIKSQAKVCYYLLSNLTNSNFKITNLLRQIDEQFSDINLNKDQTMFKNAYKFTILSIGQFLSIKRDPSNKDWDIRQIQQGLPQQLVQNILHIITSIGKHQTLKYLSQKKMIAFSPPEFKKVPQSLQNLSKQIGTCPQCSRVTNQIAVCLLCDFKSCISCQTYNLTSHAQIVHGEASVFLRVDEGYPVYVSAKKNWQMNSLYLNFMGQTYTLDKKIKNREQYKLDINQYNKVRNDIIRHRIQQQVRYMQLKTSRTSSIVP